MQAATTTLETIMNSVINTTIDLFTTLITEYWPYVLIFGVIVALVAFFGRKVHQALGGK